MWNSSDSKRTKIVAYGICGPGEAQRYMRETLDCFQRLADETIILGNNIGDEERRLIKSYNFQLVEDNREWGKEQWKIKEDFITNHVARKNADLHICLDMDEVFDERVDRKELEKLLKQPFDAFYFYIVNRWDEGYHKELSFWNIRAWRNVSSNGYAFPRKPVHCGLAPEWVWFQAYYAPFYVEHFGMMKREDRLKKIARYEKYDPSAAYVGKAYYDQLADENYKTAPFDKEEIIKEIKKHVETRVQKPIKKERKKEEVFFFVRRAIDGKVITISEKIIDETMKRNPDWELLGNSKDS